MSKPVARLSVVSWATGAMLIGALFQLPENRSVNVPDTKLDEVSSQHSPLNEDKVEIKLAQATS